MKSKSVRVGRAILLAILFCVAVFSLVGTEQNPNSIWGTVHIWAGSLLLIGSIVHLSTNLDWIKANFFQPRKTMQKHVQQSRRTNLGLFITGSLCALAAVLWLVNPTEQWSRLHTMSGMFMIVMLGIHISLHWQWMVNTISQLSDPKYEETHEPHPETTPIE